LSLVPRRTRRHEMCLTPRQWSKTQSPLLGRQNLTVRTLALILLIACLSGCGGAGNQGQGSPGGGNSQVPTLTAITLTAAQASLTVGGTSQLTAKGTYSDGSLQNITTSVSYSLTPQGFGSVSSTGLYTAPSTAGSVSIAATSGTITSSAITITVSVPPVSMMSVSPPSVQRDAESSVTYQVNGSGFTAGDVCQDFFGQFTLPSGVNPNQFSLGVTLDTPDWNPGWIPFSCIQPPSNTVNSAFLGNQNLLAISPQPQEEMFVLEAGKSLVHKFHFDTETGKYVSDGSFPVGGGTKAIALDPKTGYLVTVNNDPKGTGLALFGVYDQDGNVIFGYGLPGGVAPQGVAVFADNGYACAVQTTNVLSCVDLTSTTSTIVSVTIPSDPHNVTMMTVIGQTIAYTFSRGTSTICGTLVPQMTPTGSCTTLSGLASGGDHEFQLVLADSNTAVLLDETNTIVLGVNLTTGIEESRATLQGAQFRLAPDGMGNAVIANADAAAAVTRYASFDPASGAVTERSNTSSLLSVGFGIASDGTIISAMRDQCESVPNQ